jgi:hypothetical protein
MMVHFTTRCACTKVEIFDYEVPPMYIEVALPLRRVVRTHKPDELISSRELEDLVRGYVKIEYRRFEYAEMSGTTALYREIELDDE